MIIPIALSLGIGLVLSIALIPIIRKFSYAFGHLEKPREDRWHQIATPTFGGVAIFIAANVSIIILSITHDSFTPPIGFMVAGVIVFFVGLIDDIYPLHPIIKLIGQMIAASIIVLTTRSIGFFESEAINTIITFIWLIGITNAINLLDNMDGLAAGVSLIASLLLGYLYFSIGQNNLTILVSAIGGGILGFLLFNFPPAKIFMGDSGSLYIGFSLASLAIARVPRASNVFAVLAVPILIFLIPIIDTTLVTLTRIIQGQSPVQGGKDHTSHRLISFGMSEKQVLMILYMVSILGGVLGSLIESIDYTTSLVLLPILLIVLTLFTVHLGRIKMIQQDHQNRQVKLINFVISSTIRGRFFEILLDFLIISTAYYIGFWANSRFTLSQNDLVQFVELLPIALSVSFIVLYAGGIYRDLWQYIGTRNLIRYAITAVISVTVSLLISTILFDQTVFDISLFFFITISLFLGLALSRSSFRVFDQIYRNTKSNSQNMESNILIYGTTNESEILLNWLRTSKNTPYRTSGIIDQDPFYVGKEIQGNKIYSFNSLRNNYIEENNIQGIVVPQIDELTSDELNQLILFAENNGIWIKTPNLDFLPIEETSNE